MESVTPETYRAPVENGELTVLRFGDPAAPNVVVAAHGITGSGMAWGAVARRLSADWVLHAPDLRGRGGSGDLAGESGHGGLEGHARDVLALIEHHGGPVVLAGHSMGAYVALLAASMRPDPVTRLVLVDGGVPLPTPPGADLDAVLLATLGPAIERLAMTFDSADAYAAFFRAHPALGPHWNDDVDAYVRYDAGPVEPGGGPGGPVRSRAVASAVREDGHDLLASVDRTTAALRGLTVPTLLLRAPLGMFGEAPGFLPEAVVARVAAETPVVVEEVPGANHYTITLGPAAATVAERVTTPSTWPAAPAP